jgi:VanZ family protein
MRSGRDGAALTPDNHVSTIGRWWPALLWTGLIFAASSVPGSRLDDVGLEIPDKLVHGIEYAVLGFLVFGGARGPGQRSRARSFLLALLAAAVIGIADENYQRLIPYRDTSLADWGADVLGAACGAGLAWATRFEGLRVRRSK